MSKVFEDYFSELQADMVSIAVEYVENQAEQVFVYCSFRAAAPRSPCAYGTPFR